MECVHVSIWKKWIKKVWVAAVSAKNWKSVILNETVKKGFRGKIKVDILQHMVSVDMSTWRKWLKKLSVAAHKCERLVFNYFQWNGQKWFARKNKSWYSAEYGSCQYPSVKNMFDTVRCKARKRSEQMKSVVSARNKVQASVLQNATFEWYGLSFLHQGEEAKVTLNGILGFGYSGNITTSDTKNRGSKSRLHFNALQMHYKSALQILPTCGNSYLSVSSISFTVWGLGFMVLMFRRAFAISNP